MSEIVEAAAPPSIQPQILHASQTVSRRTLFAAFVLVSMVSFLPYRFWKQPSIIDRANWDYFAQVIARGGVPYRDVVNIKAPLSAYIGAGAILIAKPIGLRDIIAIRVVYLFIAGLTIGFTFLVALEGFRSRSVAVIAGLIMMAFNLFGDANSGGVQPKTPMILFGLMSIWAVLRDRPILAGLAGALSALCWQPGLLFVGVACLSFSRYLTRWRDGQLVNVIVGAMTPVLLFIGYFWMEHALHDIYWWLIDYNLTVDAPRGLRTVPQLIDRSIRLMKAAFRPEWPYFLLCIVGFIVAIARRLKNRGREKSVVANAREHAVFLAPLIYLAFCAINLQGAVDVIPLLPFVAMFAAVGIVFVLDFVTRVVTRRKPQVSYARVSAWSFAIAAAVIFVVSVCDSLLVKVGSPTLQDQDVEVSEIVANLGPGDEIYTHGIAEILVLSERTNADRQYFLDRGKDNYLDRVEPGGFEGWFQRLKERRPKVVLLERIKYLERKDEFLSWLQSDYDEHKGRWFTYYLRRDAN